eukprot:TRINITY_DN65430_c0_g1_i1.p1 TRINITY_DN65430_c0_g1~~TRINITY_DN65430_c0_g1_i1.p1  ORF type:complete len:370 (-),score=25.86 TRINITY_DN65430_c0_g1_i1:98-1207(-)
MAIACRVFLWRRPPGTTLLARKLALRGPVSLFSRCCSSQQLDSIRSAWMPKVATTLRSLWTPNYLVHFGNVVMLAGLSQTDMLSLRCMLVVSSSCGIAFNMLQPKPLIVPACWGLAFLSMHLYMIAMLLRERQQLVLLEEEEEVYQKAFLPYGFLRQHFVDIIAMTKPRHCTTAEGDFVVKRGDEASELHYLYEGKVEIGDAGDKLHKIVPGPGAWLGGFFDPARNDEYWQKPHYWPVSFKCIADRCRTMAFPRREVDEALRSNPRLLEFASRAAVIDARTKLQTTRRDMQRNAYKVMLEVALVDGVLDAYERIMLEEYQKRYNISEKTFRKYLAEFDWTEEEYRAGRHRSKKSKSCCGCESASCCSCA